MFERFSRSWTLIKASAGVLSKDKELLVFPALSGIATLLVMASFALPLIGMGVFEQMGERSAAELPVGVYVLGFMFYLTQYTVIFFFNTALVESLEVANLIEVAQATIVSAAARHECRGAHTVYDYEHPADDPNAPLGRDDKNWLKHTLWDSKSNSLSYKPVNLKPLTVDTVPPKVRTF